MSLPKVKVEVLDGIRGELERDNEFEYLSRIAQEMVEENPAIFDAIKGQAHESLRYLSGEYDAEQVASNIIANTMITALATYKALKVQAEVNELEEIFG